MSANFSLTDGDCASLVRDMPWTETHLLATDTDDVSSDTSVLKWDARNPGVISLSPSSSQLTHDLNQIAPKQQKVAIIVKNGPYFMPAATISVKIAACH